MRFETVICSSSHHVDAPGTAFLSTEGRTDGLALSNGVERFDVDADNLCRTCWPLSRQPAERYHIDERTDNVVIDFPPRNCTVSTQNSPLTHIGMTALQKAAMALEGSASLIMKSKAIVYTIKHWIDPKPNMLELNINANTRIQVLATMDDLAFARRSQYAAIIRDEGILIVWADSFDALIPTAQALEWQLVSMIQSRKRHRRACPPTPSLLGNLTGEIPDPLPVPGPNAGSATALGAFASRAISSPGR